MYNRTSPKAALTSSKMFLVGTLYLLCGCNLFGPFASDDGSDAVVTEPTKPVYVVLSWNNLGMHCYNRDFKDLAVLPPFNTLWAQVIKVGDPPQIVTEGITVGYSFPDNTYSVATPPLLDKSNFWDYADQLFGVELAPNVGLTGKGLAGQMDLTDDHFEANGIPLTEFRDQDATGEDSSTWQRYPFQLATVVVSDSVTGDELARSTVVAPVSTEMSCDTCHSDDGDATTRYPITPTGGIETNILTLHDYLNLGKYSVPLMDSRPVLCAKCHSSNALNAAGTPGVSSLSNAMHNHHKTLPDITPDTQGCLSCHPGPKTQCLRDTMSQNFALNCTTCHGQMDQVAVNTQPWIVEPRCDNANCHGAGYAMDQQLYRASKGHGQMYCAGCHDSPHVIAPSREPNDAIKFIALQGHAGTLSKCTVCHSTPPTNPFVHGIVH